LDQIFNINDKRSVAVRNSAVGLHANLARVVDIHTTLIAEGANVGCKPADKALSNSPCESALKCQALASINSLGNL
jgi:hypothetical protein